MDFSPFGILNRTLINSDTSPFSGYTATVVDHIMAKILKYAIISILMAMCASSSILSYKLAQISILLTCSKLVVCFF